MVSTQSLEQYFKNIKNWEPFSQRPHVQNKGYLKSISHESSMGTTIKAFNLYQFFSWKTWTTKVLIISSDGMFEGDFDPQIT